jgi:F0F1-type ATP synthase assembly protein I
MPSRVRTDEREKELIMDQKVDLTPQQEATTTQARQAITPHRLRYMLVAGIAAVVLGFFAVYSLFS